MQATPSQLGYLTLSRAIVQALVSPIGGFLGKGPSVVLHKTHGTILLTHHARVRSPPGAVLIA
jgi:hypothetical protein